MSVPVARQTHTASTSRRQQLLDAAAWTFARSGYRAASIADIVDRAGVARGTFYLYFDSKEQIFLAIVDAFADRIKRMLDEPEPPVRLGAHHGQAMLQRSFRRWLEVFAANRDAAAVVLKEAKAVDPRFEAGVARLRQLALDHFARRFSRLQAAGLVHRSTSPDLVAHLQLAMVESLVNTSLLSDLESARPIDLDALAAELAAFEWNGIRPAG